MSGFQLISDYLYGSFEGPLLAKLRRSHARRKTHDIPTFDANFPIPITRLRRRTTLMMALPSQEALSQKALYDSTTHKIADLLNLRS